MAKTIRQANLEALDSERMLDDAPAGRNKKTAPSRYRETAVLAYLPGADVERPISLNPMNRFLCSLQTRNRRERKLVHNVIV